MTDVAIHESDAEFQACVRRLSRRAMAVLDYDRPWYGSQGEIATQAAVVSDVETMLRSGERDEQHIIQRALETVCDGRIASVLQNRIRPIGASSDKDGSSGAS